MLGVILFILKTIGILLLAVIGLLLLVLLIILFIPVRYRIKLEHGEELLILDSKLSWLFHILRARVSHMNGVFHILVKVLWFTIYDNLQPRKQKVEKSKKTAKRNSTKKAVKKSKAPKEKKEIKTEQNIENRESSDISGGKQDTISEKAVNRIKETIHSDKIELKKAAEDKLQTKEYDIDTTYKIEQNGFEEQNKIEEQHKTEDQKKVQEQHKIEEKYTIDEQRKEQDQLIQEQDVIEEQTDIRAKALIEKIPVKEEKASFFKRIYNKIKEIKEKVTAFIHNLIEKIKGIFESAHNIKSKLDLILRFIQLDANKEGFKITWKSLKKIVKHVLPTELSSKVNFGTGDPCSTGQALGVLGMLYSLYGDKIQITPDFENKVLEGKHFARGRIRLVTILIIVIKLILDKRFKKLTKNIVVLKEAL